MTATFRGIEALLGKGASVIEHRHNTYASTFESEILVCRLDNGQEIGLFCKYARGRNHNAFGHRGGIAYEADVYRRLVGPSGLTAPKFYGELDGEEGSVVIEFLDGAKCADEAVPVQRALVSAAVWAARFHAKYEGTATPLHRYDRDYYRRWPRRTAELASRWHERLPWLHRLCLGAEELLPSILDFPATAIHGEFTPHNILVRDQKIFPVDWESAAIGLGEIDLVCLVDKWPEGVMRACEDAYRAARYPDGLPSDFERRLDMARLYWDLRWLGDRAEWTGSEKVGPRFEHLRVTAERLALL